MGHCTEIAARIYEHSDQSDPVECRDARAEMASSFHVPLDDTDLLSRLSAHDLRDVLAQLIVVAEASSTIRDEEQSDERLRRASEALDRFIRSAVPVLEQATGVRRPRCLKRYVDLHDQLLAQSGSSAEDARRYRKEAEETRRLVEAVEYPTARTALLEIADEWDALAAKLENEQPASGE